MRAFIQASTSRDSRSGGGRPRLVAQITAERLAAPFRFIRRGVPFEMPLWWLASQLFTVVMTGIVARAAENG
jgi:hypothetical protein